MSDSNYTSIINSLHTYVLRRGINYSLDRFKTLLTKLENPHLSFKKCIHVAGTNGKGSTVAFLKSSLMECGLTVGTYTSPHLSSYRERMQFNTTLISQSEFITLFNNVTAVAEEASEFEILTAMSFLYFKQKQPDIVLLETGLGGRLDTTNVVIPTCSVITKIGRDHQDILGSTLLEIASEKAGIIKPTIPIVTISTQKPKILEYLKQNALNKQSPFFSVSPEKEIPKKALLQGEFQKENRALAKKAIEIVMTDPINKNIIEKGINKATHWGRYTKQQHNNQLIIFDAAHNDDAFVQLFRSLINDNLFNTNSALVFGLLKRKALSTLLPLISTFPGDLYYAEFSTDSHPLTAIQMYNPRIKPYTNTLPEKTTLIVTGSILFISEFYVGEV